MAFLTGVKGPAQLAGPIILATVLWLPPQPLAWSVPGCFRAQAGKQEGPKTLARAEKGGGRPHQGRKDVLLVLLLEKHQHICHQQHQHIWRGTEVDSSQHGRV